MSCRWLGVSSWSKFTSALRGFRAVALVGLDGGQQVSRAPSCSKEDALPETPQRSRAETDRRRAALRDVVRQPSTHVVGFRCHENKLAVALLKPGVNLEACVVSDGV